jgi:flagellar biosynthetic protein FlhB
MSESAEKSFDAPPSRIAKAKREGNVPRAQEFGANLSFVAAAGATIAVIAPLGMLSAQAMRDAASGQANLPESAMFLMLACAPMAVAAVTGIGASIAQSGGLIMTALSFKPERMKPDEGIKRMFSRESATHGARAIVAFAIASAAMLPSLHDVLAAASGSASTPSVARIAWDGAVRAVFAAASVGLLFAFAEYAVARRTWLRKLRMSLAELRREMKESDGDPTARSRRRALHRSLIRGPITRTKDASFVVVNPTHIAVALEYRPPQVPVPTVLVCAADEMALRVRELAAQHRIPIVENVPLARALFKDARAGEPIAHDHYVAVAEVVAALYRSGALE